MKNLILENTDTARNALRKLDAAGVIAPVLFIKDAHQKIIGSLTDGDIRRGLIAGFDIDDNISKFMFHNFRYLIKDQFSKADISQIREKNIRFIPVLNQDKSLDKILDLDAIKSILPLTAVIMAGGKGERLMPLTQNIPKPLLKVGAKPIIEHNIDRLIKFGVEEIYISVKHFGQQIVDYFGDGSAKNCKIKYIHEEIPKGTIGAIAHIKEIQNDNILIMNSDLLTDINFEHFFEVFSAENADMGVATIPYNVNVPYAVMQFSEGKRVTGFVEKPQYSYYSNAGIYLLKKDMLRLIPIDKKFDATDLMQSIIDHNYKLIAEPLLGYWLDIGRMNDYLKAQEDIKFLKL